jgi:hypothetical protein
MRRAFVGFLSACAALLVLAAATGCSKSWNDAQIVGDIQNKLSADSGLQGKQLTVEAAKGIVTLSGTVDNPVERDAAERYAAAEKGVHQVINHLEVAALPPQMALAAPNAAAQPNPAAAPAASGKPSPGLTKRHRAPPASPPPTAPDSSTAAAAAPEPASAPPPSETPLPPLPPPPSPPPPPQKITVPSGSAVTVRLVDTIDSETAQQGRVFHATLNAPLMVDGATAIPAGTAVEGHLVNVQSAGKFAGQSLLVLQLDRVKAADHSYDLQTDQYTRQGAPRSRNTAEKVGGGAILGAILGGIVGGGKGAAIGTLAGGGVGTGVQAAGKAQSIKLDSESVLSFTLQAPVTLVLPLPNPDADRPKLAVKP